MDYTSFDDLVEYINEFSPIKIKKVNHAEGEHVGIRQCDRSFPISINESEFNFMYQTIIKFELKRGFELSTGTGISTIGIGRGFKQSGGSLISMDCYYEDLHQQSDSIPITIFSPDDIAKIKESSLTYKFADLIVKKEDLPVKLVVGYSPHDVPPALKGTNLDFVFLDCPKNDSELERDLNVLLPFINRGKFFIFLHDWHVFQPRMKDTIYHHFGVDIQLFNHYDLSSQEPQNWKYPLALITNQIV